MVQTCSDSRINLAIIKKTDKNDVLCGLLSLCTLHVKHTCKWGYSSSGSGRNKMEKY